MLSPQELDTVHWREFREISTGGGCTAGYSEIDVASERYFLVTQEDALGGKAPSGYDVPVMLGYYVEGNMAHWREFATYAECLEWIERREDALLPDGDATGWTRV